MNEEYEDYEEDDFDEHLSQLNEQQWEALRTLIADLKVIIEKERLEKIQKENEANERYFASLSERLHK